MSYYITFNGTTSTSLGIEIVRRPGIPAPEPVYEPYIIPGRDGYLMPVDITYGALEIDVEMNFISSSSSTWATAYRAARKWLSGSGNLSFSDDSGYYYKVYQASILDADRTSWRIGSFIAHFVCEPYQRLTSGDTAVTVSGSLTNNYEKSFPKYHVSAACTLRVNGNAVTIPRAAYIDTETLLVTDAANDDVINSETTGDLEKLFLKKGTNTITASAGTLRVWPHWRVL